VPDTPNGDGDGDGDTVGDGDGDGEVPSSGSLYPLVDGARWTYVEKTNSGQIEGMKIVDAVEISWEGGQAWKLTDNPNAKGNWTESVIVRDGDLTMRVHQQEHGPAGIFELVDYDPGF